MACQKAVSDSPAVGRRHSILSLVIGFRYGCYDRSVRDPIAREFLLTLWKIHILHHAGEEKGIYGQWMLEELREHGYALSPGTLYPLLARMHARGWLKTGAAKGAKTARIYRLTRSGGAVLKQLRASVGELHREVVAPFVGQGKESVKTAPRQKAWR